MSTRRLLGLTRWLLAIMVIATLQPSVAAAWVRHTGTQIALCTSEGMRWVTADDDASSDSGTAQSSQQADHCTLCRAVADPLPDLNRDDLSFAAPCRVEHVAADRPRPADTPVRVILGAPPRAPPVGA